MTPVLGPLASARFSTRRLILVLLLVGAALRVYTIGKESVWLDEAFSIWVARAGFDTIIKETSEDVHPPLYYVLLEGWIGVAGSTETGARLLSTVFGLGIIGATFAAGRLVAGPLAGLVAALLIAISPFHVEFAQEARMYTLLALLGTLSTVALMKLAALPQPATGGRPDAWRSRWWWAYVASTTLMIYTHAYSAFMLTAHAVVVLAGLRHGAAGRAFFERWFIAMLVVVLLYLPWLSVFAVQFSHVQQGFWIPEPGWWSPVETLVTYAGSTPLLWILGPLALWALVRSWPTPMAGAPTLSAGRVLMPWLVAPIALPLLLSLVGSPVFLPKYTIAASVPFAILAGMALASLPRAAGAVAITAIVGLTGVALSDYYTSPQKDGWRQAVRTLESRAEPGDVIVFYPFFTQIPWDIYRTRPDLVLAPFPEHAEQLTTTTLPWLLDAATNSGRRAWLVVMQWDTRKPLLVDRLAQRFDHVERIREWHIDLYLATGRIKPITNHQSPIQ